MRQTNTSTGGIFSIYQDRKVSTKIGLGFACTLAIFGLVAGMAWFTFRATQHGFDRYAHEVAAADTFRDLDRTFVNMRRFVREYAFTGVPANIDSANQERSALDAIVRQSLADTNDVERHRHIEAIARDLEAYAVGFEEIVSRKRELVGLETERLGLLGNAGSSNFEALMGLARKSGDADRLQATDVAFKQFLVARVDVNKLLGSNDTKVATDADKQFTAVLAALTAQQTGLQNQDYADALNRLRAGVFAYRDTFHSAQALESEISEMVSKTIVGIANQLQSEVEAVKADAVADQQSDLRETMASMTSANRTIQALSIGGIMLGIVLAWLIGRAISKPIVAACNAMEALAGGNKAIAIPGLGRKDEIGRMAEAVSVFKAGMIEADELREQSERQRVETERARKAGMLQVADQFEAGIKGVAQSVSSQASEMQIAAASLTDAAQQATDRATAVAAAVEEASVNVQVVAGSTEELSSSVQEIARQMEQSSKIAGQAVHEADRTNTIVEGMTKTAQRIGDVVALIQTIASQTNLLALNATIEAARAGDAGKGFAVVAGEVKSLASQTAKATSEIRAQIDDIQAVTGQAAEAIRGIGGIIREMNEIAIATASAVEEQGAATREIANSVRQAAAGTNEIARNVEGVSRAASETGAAASQLLGSAGELSKQAETLRHDVDGFLISVRSA